MWKVLFRQYTGSCVKFRRSFASKVLPCTSGDTVKSVMSAGGADCHDFPKEEEKILELWEKLDAFQSCLRQSKDKPRFALNKVSHLFSQCYLSELSKFTMGILRRYKIYLLYHSCL